MWDIESCHLAAARRMKLWSLITNLVFKDPQQLTKFTQLVHLNNIWQNILLQRSNCIIFGLTDIVVLFPNEAQFFQI